MAAIVSGALDESNLEASVALRWVSLATGLAGLSKVVGTTANLTKKSEVQKLYPLTQPALGKQLMRINLVISITQMATRMFSRVFLILKQLVWGFETRSIQFRWVTTY